MTEWVPFADWADGRTLLDGRRPTAGRPRLPPDDAVPAGAAARFPGDPLPGQRARRGVARRGVHAGHAARRSRSPPTSPRRPPSPSPRHGIAPRASGSPTSGCTRRPSGACRPRPSVRRPNCADAMQRLLGQVEQGRSPADDFSDRVVEQRNRPAVRRSWRRVRRDARVTLLARDLTRARERTLALVDFDDAELLRQYDPLMSPLVWDLAHIGWQEETVAAARQRSRDGPACWTPPIEGLLRRVRCTRAPAGSTCRCSRPTEARAYCCDGPRQGAGRSRRPARDDGTGSTFTFGLVVSHENQHDETMLQALNLRSGPPILGAGAPLPPGRPGVAGTSVLVPGGPFVLGVDAADEPIRSTTNAPRTSSTCASSASGGCPSPTPNGAGSSTTAATANRAGGRERAGRTASRRI